jgi:DNA-binding NarL/FixJ family response regulator
MIQLPSSHSDNPGSGGASDTQPEVILLNEKQWSYVQNRYALTPREREIAELICQGLRNGNIANALHIRPGTAKTHTRNIYRKVHVRSKISMLLRFVTDTRDCSSQYERFRSAPLAD